MKAEEFERLEKALKDAGYKKYNTPVTNNDFYYCKGFEYCTDEEGNSYPSYQILYLVWDWTKCTQVPENNKIGIEVMVIPHRENRRDLLLTKREYNINEIERIAEKFYVFCVVYLKD